MKTPLCQADELLARTRRSRGHHKSAKPDANGSLTSSMGVSWARFVCRVTVRTPISPCFWIFAQVLRLENYNSRKGHLLLSSNPSPEQKAAQLRDVVPAAYLNELLQAAGNPSDPIARMMIEQLAVAHHAIGHQCGLQDQLEHLLNLGLDKVYLLDIIAGLPLHATTVSEVFAGVALSCNAVDACHERLKYPGFAPLLPIGRQSGTVTKGNAVISRLCMDRCAHVSELLIEGGGAPWWAAVCRSRCILGSTVMG